MVYKKNKFQKNDIIDLFNKKKFIKISKNAESIINYAENDLDLWKIVIASEINLKNYIKAEQQIKKLLLKKNNAENNYLHGNVLRAQNKDKEAITAYKFAISLDNDFSDAYNNLANIQKNLNQIEEAIINYRKAIDKNKENLQAYYNLANLFKTEKKYEEAIENYKKVIELNNNFIDAYNNIGTIYSMLGKFEESRKYFTLAIEKDQFFTDSYKNYVLSTKIKEDDKIFLKLKNIIEKQKLTEEQKKIMYFSISKSYFDLNNDDIAFSYLEKANDLKLKELEYSHKKQVKNFKRIKEFFSVNMFSQIKNFDNYNFTPIFILGMPRSGTSLIEQIISNHSEVYGGGELHILSSIIDNSKWENQNNFEKIIQEIRSNYMFKLSKISNNKFITDKLPGNFKWIGFIINALPEAKILHIERNPMAVCWSNYKSNFNNTGMGFTHKQEYVAEYYILYKDLMNYWKKKFSNKIININYENFVQDYENEVRQLFKKLNLKWENQLFDFHKNDRAVETASFFQVRNKVYKNSSEQWKKYQNYLKPMMEVLTKNDISF